MQNNSVVIGEEEQLKIVKLPVNLRGTYITWRLGFNPYYLMSRETFYRHKKALLSHGIDINKSA